jgi:hypothetical protein
VGGPRTLAAPFIVPGPVGVTVRTRLGRLTAGDAEVLRQVGAYLGALADRDLKARCRDALAHDAGAWAVRRRALTPHASVCWVRAVAKATL